MAPRKRVKGKKPTETMRQRQQRLLREQRAARNKNVRSQKALTSKSTTGGRRYSTGTASSRRAQAAAKQARAAQGTKGTTVRQGQPAGAANRYYGADRVARSVRRAQIETAARKFASGKRGAASAIAIGAALGEAYKKTNRAKAESGRGAGRRTFNEKPKAKKPKKAESKVKVQKDNKTVTRKKSRDYEAEKKAREAKSAKPSKPAKAVVKKRVETSKKDNKPKVAKQVKKEETKPAQTKVAEKKEDKKKPLSKRKQMLNRRYAKLQAAAKAPGASARDRMRARQARKYT